MSLTNLPDPSRLIYGMRDTGYDFNTAAADIIDNAIAADATEVNIQVVLQQDGRKFVYFGDNGTGMDEAGLRGAMRYGAARRPNPKSLGKFGLGLKTASSSICLRYGLISRQAAEKDLLKFEWDLEYVSDNNEWTMLGEAVTPQEARMFEDLCGEKGTLVVWSKCDRLLSKDYQEPGGAAEKKAIKGRVEKLRDHVALVFHRYLEMENTDYPTVKITINGVAVLPWNPFYPERAEQVLPDNAKDIEIQTEDGSIHTAHMQVWILPHSRDMTPEENNQKARITSRGQGFYIHREGRIIQHGGWLGVFRSDDPHFSLLRVEFDFDHHLDEVFKTPVNKSQIHFDLALEERLRGELATYWNEANNRYRRKNREIANEIVLDHGSSNRTIQRVSPSAAVVVGVDHQAQEVTVNNNRGDGIRLHIPVNNNVNPDKIFIEAVDNITNGHIWEPEMRSAGSSGYRIGVRINKHHDFFKKIYLRTAALGDAVDGIDFLLWAFAAAEQNNSSAELAGTFQDMRHEISYHLTKLLKDTPEPSIEDLKDLANSVPSVGSVD
jgi:hypothetical protein